MAQDTEAARARAEATFRKPEPQGDTKSAQDAADHELRAKTQRLREARLAKESRERVGAEIRANRRQVTKIAKVNLTWG